MRLAAHQPQYLPWLGYFDKMDRADVFVLLDTVQYRKNEWQNRNRIRTREGWQWLTVPVHHRFPMTLAEVRPAGGPWRRKHREALRLQYARAPHRDAVLPALLRLLEEPCADLASLNERTVRFLAGLLGIDTPIVRASAIAGLPGGPDARLIALCRHHGCSTYVAGEGGRGYMDLGAWRRAGVRVEFQEFRHPVYPQAHPGFEPNLSAIDLALMAGPAAARVLRSRREAAA